MSLETIARIIMITGVALFLVGGLLHIFSRIGINIFQLPGDVRLQSGNVTCLIPLASAIILSIILTVILNFVLRIINK
jgi:hypothetical protein